MTQEATPTFSRPSAKVAKFLALHRQEEEGLGDGSRR